MTSITDTILSNKGKHPDRLVMHPRTIAQMVGEIEFYHFINGPMKRDKNGCLLFSETPVQPDPNLPFNVVVFQQQAGMMQAYKVSSNAYGLQPSPSDRPYTETHRMTIEGIEP